MFLLFCILFPFLFLPPLYHLINIINNLLSFWQFLSFYFSIIPLGLTILIFNQSLLVLYLTLSIFYFTLITLHLIVFISYFPPHIFYPYFMHFRNLHSIKPFIYLILCTFSLLCISLFNKPFFQSYSFCLVSLWFFFPSNCFQD